MMRAVVPALLLAVALAGCLAPATEPLPGPGGQDPAAALGALVAHQGGVLQAVPDAWQSFRARLAPTGHVGGEPTLGVTSDGSIFTTVVDPATFSPLVARSQDAGLSWEVVGRGPGEAPTTFDPWLWVDPLTDRVFTADLLLACSWVRWSDDLGATWAFHPVAGCGLPAHDHQKLTTGPPPAGVTTLGYPNVLYYAYNSLIVAGTDVRLGTIVSVSLDGGRTWTPGARAHEADTCHRGVNGPVAVAPDGTAYVAHATCSGVNVARSTDAGLTWETVARIEDHGVLPPLGLPIDMAVDEDGTAYLVYPGEDGLTYLVTGRDGGASWDEPVLLTPPGITASTFPVIAVGAPGRVAVAYLGTTADRAGWNTSDPSYAPDDTVWHLYLARSDDALAEAPSFVTARLTPEDDPVQVGCIWMRGGGNPCRNLLDFIDIVQHEGRPYIVYTDGCDRCATAEDSRGFDVVVAIVEEGPSLRDGAPLAPLVAASERARAGVHDQLVAGVRGPLQVVA